MKYNDMTTAEYYTLCVRIYHEAMKADGDLDEILAGLEDAGFSREDLDARREETDR